MNFALVMRKLPPRLRWRKLSFPSTLYLCPVLDLLVADVPKSCQDEVRLGLQEALVNAAKHGNDLDPKKRVFVWFSQSACGHWWTVADQGGGFEPPCHCHQIAVQENNQVIEAVEADEDQVDRLLPDFDWECGRGLFILHQVFDQVQWSECGRQIRLYKAVSNQEQSPHQPTRSPSLRWPVLPWRSLFSEWLPRSRRRGARRSWQSWLHALQMRSTLLL